MLPWTRGVMQLTFDRLAHLQIFLAVVSTFKFTSYLLKFCLFIRCLLYGQPQEWETSSIHSSCLHILYISNYSCSLLVSFKNL